MLFFFRFTWLCITGSRFMHLTTTDSNFFLFMAEWYSIYIYGSFPGGSMVKNLPSMQETQGMRFDPWVRKKPWRGKWQFTPIFLSGKSQGQRSLAGYSPWAQKNQTRLKWLNTHMVVLFLFFFLILSLPRPGKDADWTQRGLASAAQLGLRSLFLFFKKTLHIVLHSGCIICIPTNSATWFLFPHILSSIFVLRLFGDSHSDWCQMIHYCGFYLLSIFSCIY